jgi:uncharacterized repeat protein (TIGR01451 family)
MTIFTRKPRPAISYGLAVLIVLTAIPRLEAVPRQFLPGHLPPRIGAMNSIGRLPQSQRLSVAVGLPLRNPQALTNLLEQLYDPASPQYHQWLSVAQFTESFGPSEKDYQAVSDYLETQGFKVIARYPNRMVLDVSGTVATIEKAFHLNLLTYSHPKENRTYFAPDAEPSLDIAVPLLHISGLDNYELARPANLVVKSSLQAQGATPQAGSGPGGAYMGPDFRAAYAAGVTLTGTGQYVGLLEFDGYYPSDITTYASMAGLTNVPLQNVLLDEFSGAPGSANDEVALDIEMALSMAPGLAGVIVYEGKTGDSVLNRMAADNVAKQLSASWTYPTDALTTQIFQQFGAQGQSYFNASGDSGAYSGSPSSPSDNPYITSVGGTTLTTRGPAGAWVSEKVWSWISAGTGNGASSGGISATWAIPSWQVGISTTGNHGSSTMRNIPDVAMVADNVLVVANNGQQLNLGGTSCASPLWASLVALMNQQAALNSQQPVGFINPAVYAIGKGTSYTTDFHDTRTGNNTNSSSPTLFYAAIGYDLCTGWGTPIGKALINALVPPSSTPFIIAGSAGLAVETCPVANGALNPGEPVTVNFSLQNIGAANTANLVATLLTNSGVQPVSGPQSYGALVGGGAAVSRSFTLIPNGNCGGTASPTLQLQDGSNNLGTVVFNFSLGAPAVVLSQNFDGSLAPALPVGWSRAISGTVSNWVTTTSFRYSSPNSAGVIGTTNAGVSELISPVIPITTSQAQLSFWNNFVTEIDPTNSTDAFDGGVLEIQIGSGAYTDILAAGGTFVTNGYGNRTLDATTGNPLAGRQVWAGTSGSFINTIVNLPVSAAGQNVRLKWRLATDTGNGDGSTFWYLDNVMVSDGTSCCAPPASADLAVGQSESPSVGLVGQPVAYSIAVTNLGPGPAVSTVLTAALPANSTFTYGSAGCVYSNGNVTCSVPLLVNGGRTNYTIIVTPLAEGTITNTLIIGSSVSDPNSANNTATVVTPVFAAPAITQQPTDQVVFPGGTANFVVLATGTAPLSYGWSFGSSNITGATASTLSLTNVQASQAGVYTVTISNAYGSITSDPANLVLVTPPTISLSSLNATSVNLSVSSLPGVNYMLEYKNALKDPSWTPIPPAVQGNGLTIILVDTNGTSFPSRFYRVNLN